MTGRLVVLDPDADEAFDVSWDLELATGVTLTSSLWLIDGRAGAAALDQHDDDIGQYDVNNAWEANASGRVTRVFLTGATGILAGQLYTVTNRIVTNETPPQTKDASFSVLIQHE